MGVVGCVCTYLFTRTIWNRRAGLIASVIQGTSFLYFCMAHTITLDASLTFFLTFSLYSFILGVRQLDVHEKGYLKWFYCAYVFSALAVMSKGLIGVVFPILIAGLWVMWSGRWSLLWRAHLIPGLFLIVLICLPWHYAMQQQFPEFFDFYFIQQHVSRYATPISQRAMHKLGYLGLVVLGIFPWTVFAAGALKKVWQERLEATSQYAVFLAIWGGSIILFFFFSHSVLVPYLLPIIAPFSIVLALYIDEKWKQKVAMWIRVVFCLACFLLGVGFCIAPYFREMGEGIAVWVHLPGLEFYFVR
jgi:4-amino-4-deoxy-L-arabinose transferase-like glycosyltransferase